MSKRIAIAVTILLLFMQATPVLACVVMPMQALGTCCCEQDRDCAMGHDASGCATADACCVQASSSTPALGNVAERSNEHPIVLPSANGAPPFADSLILVRQRENLAARHFIHHASAPPTAVPLYLRHLRLTL